MQPLGSGAEGTFDLTGDANINSISAQ
jgi:hypothetical protein